jgi:hypothetical protein
MPTEPEATSAAPIADAQVESGNLTGGQAAASLFAKATKVAVAPKPNATEEKTQEAPAAEADAPETQESTVADSEAESAEKPTEEAEPAEETTAEPETEESEDEVLSHRSQLDAKTKEKIQKRIGKEVAKTKAEKARAEAAEARAAELDALLREKEAAKPDAPAPQILPSDLPPHIAAITDLNGIQKTSKEAREAIRWAEAMLDAEAEGDALPEGWDRKKLKETIRNAKVSLEEYIPQRADFIKERQRFQQIAHQKFSFLRDRNDPDYARAQSALKAKPWFNSLPDGDLLLGFMIKGLKTLEAEDAEAKAKAKAPAAKPKVIVKPSSDQTAVSSTGTSVRTPVATAQRQALAAEKAKIDAKGGLTAQEAAAFLTRSAQSRNSR